MVFAPPYMPFLYPTIGKQNKINKTENKQKNPKTLVTYSGLSHFRPRAVDGSFISPLLHDISSTSLLLNAHLRRHLKASLYPH